MAGAAVLGSLTIPGRPEHVREARGFVAKALGELHPSLDNAVLLTSELVTNAVMHSNSRCQRRHGDGPVLESAGGVRIEVADEGSDLSAPVVRGDVYASDGHGLSSCRRCPTSGATSATTRARPSGSGSAPASPPPG